MYLDMMNFADIVNQDYDEGFNGVLREMREGKKQIYCLRVEGRDGVESRLV
jgi:hypothetical protein